MLIWLTAILLFALFGALGYFKGAVRMIFPLVGLFAGIFLALPLAPLVQPLIPLVGLKNPIWSLLLPPVVVFFLIAIVFIVVGFFGHAKVNLIFKYRGDDYERLSWERLNRRLGVAVGLIAGAVYTLLLGVVVYVLGYFTVQVSAGDSDVATLRYLNQARADLRSSGLEKTVAAFDFAPESYYNTADIAGLLYHNSPLYTRLSAYPPFLTVAERENMQKMATDTEYQNLLSGQSSLAQIIQHPMTQELMVDQDLIAQLKEVDLKDLRNYLETGVSEQYLDQPILGRWEVDPYLTLMREKRRKVQMTSAEMRLLRYHIEFVRGFKLILAPDSTALLKGPDVSQMMNRLQDLERAAQSGNRSRPQARVLQQPMPTSPSQPGPGQGQRGTMDAVTRNRYGLGPAQQTTAPQQTTPQLQRAATSSAEPTPALVSTTELGAQIAQLPIVVLAQGNWKEDGAKYRISLRAQKPMSRFVGTDRNSEIEASVRDDFLYLKEDNDWMVLMRY